MTTGLITFFQHHHYGAQLQAYAAMRAMTELGHPCQIINYRPDYDAGLNDLFRKGGVRTQLVNAHTAAHYAALKRRAERFDAFVADYMNLTPQCYTSYQQLCENPPECSVFVSGSDQIWNPSIYPDKTFDPAYLLGFVKEGRRISYAPSMGSRPFTEDENAKLREALDRFDAVSVRESAGSRLVTTATGKEPVTVLDPTLLLTRDQWAELAVPPSFDFPYILCYYISDHSVLDPYAEELAARTGLPILQIGMRRKLKYADRVVLDAGTREFLGLFQNASYVLTNSFHGTVFSIQFGKEFYTTVSPKEMEHPENSRVYSLLTRLGCATRVAGMEHADDLDTPVDYETVNARLQRQRERCLSWLSAAIEGRAWSEPPVHPSERPIRKWPRLAEHHACTGCSACEQVCPADAIRMQQDQEGFFRPVVTQDCILCRKCERVCPAIHPTEERAAPLQAWAVWNRDPAVREHASSGGFFPALASRVISEGGAVFGAVYSADFRSVYHTCARTMDELRPMSGSKYVQSDLRDSFRQTRILLDDGVTVLFSGLPCQIAGLMSYLGRNYENLITCDMVCNSVSSPAVYTAFIDQIRSALRGEISSLDFKAGKWNDPHFKAAIRRPAQPPAKGLLRFRKKEQLGEWSERLYSTTYGRGFGMLLFQRSCCAQCPYTSLTTRPADFTMADFWGLGDDPTLPADRDKGISLVLTHNEKARVLLAELSDRLGMTERPIEEALAGNPRLAYPMSPSPKRPAFFATFRVRGWATASQKFLSQPSPLYRAASRVLTPEMKQKVRKLLG